MSSKTECACGQSDSNAGLSVCLCDSSSSNREGNPTRSKTDSAVKLYSAVECFCGDSLNSADSEGSSVQCNCSLCQVRNCANGSKTKTSNGNEPLSSEGSGACLIPSTPENGIQRGMVGTQMVNDSSGSSGTCSCSLCQNIGTEKRISFSQQESSQKTQSETNTRSTCICSICPIWDSENSSNTTSARQDSSASERICVYSARPNKSGTQNTASLNKQDGSNFSKCTCGQSQMTRSQTASSGTCVRSILPIDPAMKIGKTETVVLETASARDTPGVKSKMVSSNIILSNTCMCPITPGVSPGISQSVPGIPKGMKSKTASGTGICSICPSMGKSSSKPCICELLKGIESGSTGVCDCPICPNEMRDNQGQNDFDSSTNNLCTCDICENQDMNKTYYIDKSISKRGTQEMKSKTSSGTCICDICPSRKISSSKPCICEILKGIESGSTGVCDCLICPNEMQDNQGENEFDTCTNDLCTCDLCPNENLKNSEYIDTSAKPSGICACGPNKVSESTDLCTCTPCPNASFMKALSSESCICKTSKAKSSVCDSSTSNSCVCLPSPEENYYSDQLCKQDKFWNTTIKQLNDHIKSLECEKCSTEYSVQKAEISLLPYISYQMIQLSTTRPNLNVNCLFAGEFPIPAATGSSRRAKLPDLPTLELFVVQDNDVLYMDIIRAHLAEANLLQGNIDRLRNHANALLATKNTIEEMAQETGIPENIVVNAKNMKDLLQRLTDSKSEMGKELDVETIRQTDLQTQVGGIMAEIAKEKGKTEQLIEGLNYAGANVEIATVVMSAKEPAQVREYVDDIKGLHKDYDKLKAEAETLYKEIANIKAQYKAKTLEKYSSLALNSPFGNNSEKGQSCLCEDNNKT